MNPVQTNEFSKTLKGQGPRILECYFFPRGPRETAVFARLGARFSLTLVLNTPSGLMMAYNFQEIKDLISL